MSGRLIKVYINKILNYFRSNREFVLLTFILVVTQIIWYMFLGGVKYGNDSIRYFSAVELLREGNISDYIVKQRMMLSYILFLAIHRVFTENDIIVILSQCAIFTFSGLLLWSVIKEYCSKSASYFLIIIYFGFFHLARWNYYVLTDSLAISGSMLIVWLLHKSCSSKDFNIWPYMPFIVYIAFIRPHLSMIVFAFLLFITFKYIYLKKQLLQGIVIMLCLITLLVGLFFIQYSDQVDNIFKTLLRITKQGTYLRGYGIDMPEPERINGPISNYLTYVYKNFHLLFGINIFRIFLYFTMLRPYYSFLNNAYLLLMGILIYGLSTYGLLFRSGYWQLKSGLLMAILSNVFLISITFISWDSRYVMYIMPHLWVIMSLGIDIPIKQVISISNRLKV